MANYGIKVSQDGYDVKTATLLQQTFNSEKNCIKLSTVSGTLSHTFSSSGTYTFEISHGFSFVPGFLVWFEKNGNGNWYFMYTLSNCIAYSDSSKLYVEVNGNSGDTYKIYYVVFADNAT